MKFVIFILLPLSLLLYWINDLREKKGKKAIAEGYIFPVGLFITMWIVAYQMGTKTSEVLVIFFFGALIGSTFEHFSRES